MNFPDISDGILLVDKPANMTSFGVVARVRRVLSERLAERRRLSLGDAMQGSTGGASAAMRSQPKPKVKVGHTGTLDPFATGLMILVIGKECRNAEKYSKLDKVYEATIRLGETSTTGDPEGEISEAGGRMPDAGEVKETLKRFTGEIEQTPPMFSAIKVNGQRAYKLARKGEKVEIPVRRVTIYSLELLDYSYPELKVRVHVSSGTYIRSLAEDIGVDLDTGAYCSQLRRLKVATYDVTDAYKIADDGILTK